jgi:protein-S-isoprenylcysteine O-methyltransferase Ste14
MKPSFIQRGGWWVIIQFALMIAVLALGLVWRGSGWGKPVLALGVGWFVLGGVFGIAGVAVLGRNRTPFPQPQLNSELVQRGIYSRVRHPLYVSVMLMALGWAVIWQSWPALIVALSLIPFFHAKARREEHWLGEKFPDYADYIHRVPRFIPRLRTGVNLVCNF